MTTSCKVFLDTNILVDVAVAERPEHLEAERLFGALARGRALGHVSPLSLKNFFYITRKRLPAPTAREWIELFMDVCGVVPVSRDSCRRAAQADNPDFEDALIEAAVCEAGADYLISRDLEGFRTLSVPRVSAGEFLALAGIA